jgi:polysaccharide export outer membrane protein
MKKMLTIFLILIFVLIMFAPSLMYSQELKSVDSAREKEKGVKSDIATNSDQYIIGPEDVIHIFVWKEESLTKTVPVRMDGKISLPLVDDIQAEGLTPLQLKDALTKALKGFVDNPTVSVTVTEVNSYKVYVTGEVKQPGVHQIRSQVTLVKAITLAGGLTEWANKKNIIIITKEKGTEKRIIANYNKIIAGETPDIVINRGDIVVVK